MFKVQDTILTEEIATTKFACDLPRCKGACCVVGDAGAPVVKDEIPVLHKAYRLLKDEMRPPTLSMWIVCVPLLVIKEAKKEFIYQTFWKSH